MKTLKKYTDFLLENNLETGNFEYNDMIDYTLLDNKASDDDIIELCEKAKKFGTKSVCVMPKHVSIAASELLDSKVLVCTVISFPEGTYSLQEKESETDQVIRDGADEVDMVLNYQKLKETWTNPDEVIENDDEFDTVSLFTELVEEVKSLVNICHSSKNKDGEDVILKVIVESGLLTGRQTETATDICIEAGADYIKTSTGMVGVGAEMSKIKIMKDVIIKSNSNMKIKASGGVRSLNDIETFGVHVDRFGMGYGSVDTLNGMNSSVQGY